MSKDSSATYLHMHFPHLADHFEDFCRPPSSQPTAGSTQATGATNQPSTTNNNTTTASAAANAPSGTGPGQPGAAGNDNMAQLPGHFLPFEEIQLPAHLMPLNPEDEDDVVPDMHAAFGINRALGQHQNVGPDGERVGQATQSREPVWRDLGLEELVRRGPSGGAGGERMGGAGGVSVGGVGFGIGRGRRDGKRSGLMMMR